MDSTELRPIRSMHIRILFVLLMAVLLTPRGDARAQGWEPLPGLTFEAEYTGEYIRNLSGGLRRDDVYLHSIDLTATADIEKLGGWHGATLFLYGMNLEGGAPSSLVGDVQGVSNIEADDAFLLYEAWFEQILFDGHVSLLGGLYGLDSEFDVVSTAGLFPNSSHGTPPALSQSGLNGPSIFPVTSVGLRMKIVTHTSWSFKLAVLDGVPGRPGQPGGVHVVFGPDDGLLLVGEIAYQAPRGDVPAESNHALRHALVSRTGDVPFRTRAALGVWTYTASFDDIMEMDGSGNPLQRKGNHGLYGFVERQVFAESRDPSQGLSLHARFGLANEQINRFVAYTGGGAVYAGPLPGRNDDVVGVGVAVAHNGDPYMQAVRSAGGSVLAREWNVEFAYQAALRPWLSILGDVQAVFQPDMDPGLDDALMIGLRVMITP